MHIIDALLCVVVLWAEPGSRRAERGGAAGGRGGDCAGGRRTLYQQVEIHLLVLELPIYGQCEGIRWIVEKEGGVVLYRSGDYSTVYCSREQGRTVRMLLCR